MKVKLMFVFIALLTVTFSHSQKKNEVRFLGGFASSGIFSLEDDDIVGGERYVSDTQIPLEIGVKYLRNITPKFRIETGILLSKTKVQMTNYYDMPNRPNTIDYENLKVLQIPLYANYSFWKYFFVNGGFLLSFDKSNGTIDSQSGIGYGIGFGTEYAVKDFVFYLNPNFKRCTAFVPFHKEDYHEKFTELGVEFGIGYRF